MSFRPAMSLPGELGVAPLEGGRTYLRNLYEAVGSMVVLRWDRRASYREGTSDGYDYRI